ncbi:putative ribonuclease H-like domain-containing protein [Tanacetum coccineum]
MTGNKAYLAEYQDFNGGRVAFEGSKGYITGKGKIKTGKLDFEDVCFVKELQHFNLFSVSQMCDKKNKVLFTDTESESAQDYYCTQYGLFYTSTVKSSKVGEEPTKHPDFQQVDKEDQIFLDELKRIKRQEHDANDAAEALRKEFAQETEDLLLQARAAKASNEGVSDLTSPIRTLSVNVSPIPTSRINSIHPSTLILRDPQSAVQTRSKVTKSSGAHAFLVAQGHKQEEGINYDEVFAPVAKIEAIRIFLAFDSYMGFMVYQMDVKSAFLYGKIDERSMLSSTPVMDYRKELVDILFLKKGQTKDILYTSYVDDIIFGSTKKSWCDEFEALVKSRFQMSSIRELTFSLRLQVKQKEDGIFISQDKYVAEILKKFDFASVKTASTPIKTQKPLVKDEEASDVDVTTFIESMIGSLMYLKGKPKLGLWYPRLSSFDLQAYLDSDYAGENLDRKSTTGGILFLQETLFLGTAPLQKEKGVELDVENIERPRLTSTRSLLTLKSLPKIDPKDKGKKKIKEDESDTESEDINETKKKFKMLAHDEEIARKMQEDWETEEERKRLAEEEATNAALIQDFDDIKARMEADRILALRLQEEEREQFTVEESAKFLHDTIASQRRFLTEQRAIAIRNKPPSRTQLRNQMMTYLKHVGNKKHSDLKNKTFEEIQALYEKVKRFDESLTTVGSTEDESKIKEMNEGGKDLEQKRLKKKVTKETPKKEDTVKVPAKVDVTEQGMKKRKGGHMKMLARKRKRPQPDVDSDDEHRKCLKIVTFEGTIDSEIMERKSVIARLNKVSSPDGDYLVIYRANGNFRAFNYLMELLHIFDRQDLFHLYDLVMKQYSEVTLEGFELILWGDLKIMMESSTEENDQSDFWSDQQDWKIVTWRLYEACGVYILELEDGTVIHMLVERRYPLSKDLLQRMLDLGLEVERESTAALDLIRFIKQQIDEE